MAFPKAIALQKASFYADSIIEHVIKIVLYHDIRSNDVPHWISELATWIHDADDITVKPTSRKLKPVDIENSTFAWMGNELKDYRSDLDMFQENNRRGKFNNSDKGSYPYVETTRQLAQELMDVCYELMNSTIPLICDKKDHDKLEYNQVLQRVFKNYL